MKRQKLQTDPLPPSLPVSRPWLYSLCCWTSWSVGMLRSVSSRSIPMRSGQHRTRTCGNNLGIKHGQTKNQDNCRRNSSINRFKHSSFFGQETSFLIKYPYKQVFIVYLFYRVQDRKKNTKIAIRRKIIIALLNYIRYLRL